MAWQDFVFLAGSLLSVAFLFPTLRDSAACVPRATSVPSMVIGAVYSFTFLTLGMSFSAFGAFAACSMWSLIVCFRAPGTDLVDAIATRTGGRWSLLVDDCYRWTRRLFVPARYSSDRYVNAFE
ncbi:MULTISPECIES: hypothetical protein [Natrialbaceae]|uniref:hypothetical protein n=1 Tax=Natrialbaceae TaxID=1644061 RepID=UPI00207CA02B|nr:hypothetical protein [Natronococcus sp. CG52]